MSQETTTGQETPTTTPTAGEAAKPVETAPNAVVPKDRFDSVYARAKAAEDKLAELKKTQDEANRKALEEQGRFKEMYEAERVKAAVVEEMTKAVESYLGEEIAGLDDTQKALIPEGSAHQRLAWVKKAKAAGLFADGKATPKTFDGKVKHGAAGDKWYLSIPSSDPRFNDLTAAQYAEWKAANGKTGPKGFKGGF